MDGDRPWVHWSVVALDFLAFSQLGWLGALLMVGGYLAKNDGFRKVAVWTSAISVAAHGFFLIVGLVWNALSA